MKNLRLLLWEDCNRSCPGCCNKDWDLKNLPEVKISKLNEYDLVMLTGGEVMLNPDRLTLIAEIIRKNTKANIIMYTAFLSNPSAFARVLEKLDGVTLTLHEKEDALDFVALQSELKRQGLLNKMLRLNVFSGIEIPEDTEGWNVKKEIEWIKDCPLPSNEDFLRW